MSKIKGPSVPIKAKLNDKQIVVRLPTAEELKEGDRVHAKTYNECLDMGIPLAAKLEKSLREQNVWTEEMDKRFAELKRKLFDSELKLKRRTEPMQKGSHGVFDKNTYYGLAIEMQELRNELFEMTSLRTSLEMNSAEGRASSARINYLIYACTVYEDTNKRVFSSYEDFSDKAQYKRSDDDKEYPVIEQATSAFYELFFGNRRDSLKDLPENAWLIKYGFMDNELNLINKEGKRINRKGQLIDEFGRPVNDEGDLIDINGNAFTDEGEYLVEPQPFVDEQGKPILDDEYKAELEEFRKKKIEWEERKAKLRQAKEETTKIENKKE
jgi:hypothetical protein